MFKKFSVEVVILLAVVIIVVGTGSYFVYFHDTLSRETTEWANFAVYVGLFVNISNVAVLAYLSSVIHKFNIDKDRREQSLQFTEKLSKHERERPVIFARIRHKPGGENSFWEVQNIGVGAAMNMRINYFTGKDKIWQERSTKAYSLAPKDSLVIRWVPTSAWVLCIVYQDILNKQYASITVGDESFIFDYVKERDGGSLFRLPETDPEAENDEIINEGDVEKMMALGTQRISHAELRGT